MAHFRAILGKIGQIFIPSSGHTGLDLSKMAQSERAYEKECDHVNDEAEDDDRIAASLGQKLAENSEEKSTGDLADADDDTVKSNLLSVL